MNNTKRVFANSDTPFENYLQVSTSIDKENNPSVAIRPFKNYPLNVILAGSNYDADKMKGLTSLFVNGKLPVGIDYNIMTNAQNQFTANVNKAWDNGANIYARYNKNPQGEQYSIGGRSPFNGFDIAGEIIKSDNGIDKLLKISKQLENLELSAKAADFGKVKHFGGGITYTFDNDMNIHAGLFKDLFERNNRKGYTVGIDIPFNNNINASLNYRHLFDNNLFNNKYNKNAAIDVRAKYLF